MAAVDYTDALEHNWRIFPLYPIVNGKCSCEKPDCNQPGKHPRASNWQHTQPYAEDQLAYLEDHEGMFFGNQLLDHYGIVVKTSGLFIVDVDIRNGGFESAKKLAHIREQCGFIVQTGGGGEHWYFSASTDEPLRTNHPDFRGIDFKSTGFVVGCGALHHSGYRYEALSGSPSDITPMPAELVELLKKPVASTFSVSSGDTVEIAKIIQMLKFVKHDEQQSYERWRDVGMFLHHGTGGSEEGLELWRQWSISVGRPDTQDMDGYYHKFNKEGANLITIGTLFKWAQEGGYVEPVTFVDNTDWGEIEVATDSVTNPSINLKQPPGLVGEITKWINSRCLYPRENLAVAAAIQIVSNVAGLNYLVDEYRTSLNLITLCIAGSRTGKGAIKSCIDEVHSAMGIAPATHGKFKSSQELVRNAIRHQCIHYIYDEFGKQLEKVSGASRGGAHYLEDLMSDLIAIYSVATGSHGISGDMKQEITEDIEKRMMRAAKREGLADDESIRSFVTDNPDSETAQLYESLKKASQGIQEPYLTFFALSEPHSYSAALEKNPWLSIGGFLGRALFFEELDNVPIAKPIESVSREPLPESIAWQLRALSASGESNSEQSRIERKGDWRLIKWSAEAKQVILQCAEYWRSVALSEVDQGSGLESQALGAVELTIKVAGTLSVATEMIDAESVKWAHELIKTIVQDKIARAKSSEKLHATNAEEKGEGLLEGLIRHLKSAGETTPGKARQAVGRSKVTLDQTIQGLDHLASTGVLSKIEQVGKNGRTTVKYKYKNT